jgi:hypothetical protein
MIQRVQKNMLARWIESNLHIHRGMQEKTDWPVIPQVGGFAAVGSKGRRKGRELPNERLGHLQNMGSELDSRALPTWPMKMAAIRRDMRESWTTSSKPAQLDRDLMLLAGGREVSRACVQGLIT